MAHKHNIYDTDNHYTISAVTRAITNVSPTKVNIMQYDHNSERLTFELPRYIEDHDMSLCNSVQVHYLNTDGKNTTSDVYEVDDLQISPDGENVVICSWLISQNATRYAGSLSFLVRFACVSEDGTIDYAWNTDIYKNLSVSNGIYNSDIVVEQYSDILEKWKEELFSTGGESGETVTDEQIAAAVEDYLTENPIEGGQGKDGVGILSVEQTTTSTADGGENVVTVTKTDNTTSTFTVRNGSKGNTGDSGADGVNGKDGVSVTVTNVSESTEDGGENVVTFSDGKTLNVRNGKTGAKGDPGNDYVLTDADKQEIAGMIPGGSSGGSAGVVIFSVLYTDEQVSFLEAPVVYPVGADMDTLLAAGQVQMVMLTPSDSGDGAAKLGVLLPTSVDVDGQTIVFAGTITGKDGNEAVMAELHTGTGEITVMPMVQNSAGSGGGGGIVTITANDDGTYSSSHTPAEIAAMAQTGAVVAEVEGGVIPLLQYNADMAVFSLFMIEDSTVGCGVFTVTNDGVSFEVIYYYVGEMHGADTDNDGTGGTVPAPSAGAQNMVLHGNGTWRAALSEDDKTDLVHRVLEKLPTWEGGTY